MNAIVLQSKHTLRDLQRPNTLSDLYYQTLRVDTYIIDSLRTGRRFELKENDVNDTHFRAWCLEERVETWKLDEEENETKNNGSCDS